MATQKARFIVTVDDQMAQAIEDFHYENRFKDRSKALLALIQAGLESKGIEVKSPEPPVDLDILLGEDESTTPTPKKSSKKPRISLS
jgi:hypothetical protein